MTPDGTISTCVDGGASLEAKLKFFTAKFVLIVLTLGCSLTGCSSDEDFNFSEGEMRASVAGKYEGTVGSTSERIHIVLDEAGVPSMLTNDMDAGVGMLNASISRRSILCASREFGTLASKCGLSSTMNLVGNVASDDGTIPASTLTGSLAIYGSDLTGGNLQLATESGDIVSAEFASSECCVSWIYRSTGIAQAFPLNMSHQ